MRAWNGSEGRSWWQAGAFCPHLNVGTFRAPEAKPLP
jgi:hypothetical protein